MSGATTADARLWLIAPYYTDGCVTISHPGAETVLVRPVTGCSMKDAQQIAQDIVDAMNASLSAAPGEPCAWRHQLFCEVGDCVRTQYTLTEAHPFGLPNKNFSAEFKIVSIPLYRSPQPAAGWDELPAIPDEDADFTPDLARKIIAKYQQIITSLRREAPAPAEGVTVEQLLAETECKDADDLRDMALVGQATMAAVEVVVTSEGPFKGWSPAQCPSEIISDLCNALDEAARSDTAEARLREALEKTREAIVLCIAFLGRDIGTDRIDATLRSLAEELAKADRLALQALSPPSGGDEVTNISVSKEMALQMTSLPGDEAKESEGGEPTFGCKRAGGFVDTSCTAPCDCHVTQRLSRPSEPSPPADRREVGMESILGRPYGQEKGDVTCMGSPCGWPTCDCGRV